MKTLLGGLFFLAISATLASADISVNYEPGSPASLGKNLDPTVATLAREDCIEFDGPTNANFAGGPNDPIPVDEVRINSRFISDYKEFYELFSMNAEFKAEATIKAIATIKADTGLSVGKEFTRTANNIILVVSASYDFGTRIISNAHLKDAFAQLVANNDAASVTGRCGTHYVAREQRWAYAALVIKANNVSDSLLRSLKARLNVEGSMKGFGSASTNLNLTNTVKEISKYSSVTIDFLARGGDPTKAAGLAKVVADQNVANALTAMSDYMASVRFQTSVPSRFWLVPIPNLPQVVERPEKLQFIRDTYFQAIGVQTDIDTLTGEVNRLAQNNLSGSQIFSTQNVQLLRLQQRKIGLEAVLKACILHDQCSTIMPGGEPTTSLAASLQNWSLSNICTYGPTRLDNVEVMLSAEFMSTSVLSDLEAFKTDGSGARTRTVVNRTGFSSDPEQRRVVARIDNIGVSSAADDNAVSDMVRGTNYELHAISKIGLDQWYVLGQPPFNTEECPTAGH